MTNKSIFAPRTRDELEQLEETTLAVYAGKSRKAHKTRHFVETEHAYRTSFQRDRDRIIHSRAFRRLKHKRQVFLTSQSDHLRTRLTHTLEVAQLARTMAKVLALNEDLIEAIALGHDLGHTPFGHLGEVILNDILTGKRKIAGQSRGINYGGFKHNYQSVRVVDKLEKKYIFPGLNLTAPVREGILKHTRLKREIIKYPDFDYTGLLYEQSPASTIEGQVVAICDEIAQRTHDLEDGIRAGLVELKAVRRLEIVRLVESSIDLAGHVEKNDVLFAGLLVKGLINLLVDDVIQVTVQNITKYDSESKQLHDFDRNLVEFSPEIDPLQKQLNQFIFQEIINFSRIQWSDEFGKKLLLRLFETYFLNPGLLPDSLLRDELNLDAERLRMNTAEQKNQFKHLQTDSLFLRAVCDYIAGMTDHFAIREAERLAKLDKLNIDDLQIKSALGDDFY